MIEDHRRRVEKAVADMINDIYKTHLRRMQCEMHLCAANCCEDISRQPQIDNVQTCIEDCAGPLIKAQDYLQHELGQFQHRLQNCVMQCSDDVRGRVPNSAQASDLSKFSEKFVICTGKCVDQHIDLIPKMMSTMKSVLAKGPSVLDRV